MAPVAVNFTVTLEGLATIATLLAVVIVLHAGLRQISNHVSIHTFNEYSHKYHEILARFPIELWTTKNLTLASLSEPQAAEFLSAFSDFLRLLAGERHLRRIHFIDTRTWNLWSASSRHIMALPISREAWNHLRPKFSYDPNFQKFVDGFL